MTATLPAVAAATLTVVGGAAAQQKPGEQRITELIEQLRRHDYQQAASWELVRIGVPAVRPLVDALQTEHSPSVQLKVINTLGRMRADAISSLPTLLTFLNGRGVFKSAWTAVGDIGPYSEDPSELGEPLLQAFRSSHVMNVAGAGALRSFGPLSLPYFYVRAVSRLEIDPNGSTDILVDVVETSDNPYAVAFAAQLLGERSTEAERLVPLLERCAEEARSKEQGDVLLTFTRAPSVVLGREDWRDAYYAAAEALAQIAPLTPQAIPGHRFRLRGGANVKLEDRVSSVSALVSMGSSAVEAVPELIASAGPESGPLAREAITALGMIGPAAKDAIPLLEKLSEHEDPQIAVRANAALRQIRDA